MMFNRKPSSQLKKPDALYIGAPNPGILDQWLPVLWELKKRNPYVVIFAAFPMVRTATESYPQDVLVQMGERLFDGALFQTADGEWFFKDSLIEAGNLARKKNVSRCETALKRVGRRKNKNFIMYFISKACVALRNLVFLKESRINLKELSDTVKFIYSDIYVEKKEYTKVLQENFKKAIWVSICHGLVSYGAYDINCKSKYKNKSYRKVNKFLVYANSTKEKRFYRKIYDIGEEDIKTVGIPRHSEKWIKTVINKCGEHDLDKEKYIFVVSRPANSNYFPDNPKKSKESAARDIKNLSEKLQCKVIIRLHPKEKKEGIFERVFGRGAYGEKWEYSYLHPFVLGKHSLFCITFFSGIVHDMNAIGVPVIERSNIDKLKTAPGNARDIIGKPMSVFRKLGMALGADNYKELENKAWHIINNREEVVLQQKKAYKREFEVKKDSIMFVVNDIERELKNRNVAGKTYEKV